MRTALNPTLGVRADETPTGGASARPYLLVDLYQLTKPGITRLVVLTTAVGFYMASGAAVDILLLLHAVIGTTLVASGAGALNQLVERNVDARMERTRNRPLPGGRISPAAAAWFGWSLGAVGTVYLAALVNPTTTAIVAATLVVYVFVYTPLKLRTTASTIIGTIPGALPIVAGWTAAGGPLDLRAGTLFAILALWQIPHFLALAWLYRDDYRRGGMVMLSVLDPDGQRTGGQIVNYALALLIVSLLPTFLGLTGRIYFAGAFVLGTAFLALGVALILDRTDLRARRLFLGSVLYLPALMVLMAVDKIPPV